MVDSQSTSALREAGEAYQIIFRVLDLLCEDHDSDICERLSRLPDSEIGAVVAMHGRRSVEDARVLVHAFIADHGKQEASLPGISNILALKRRGLIEYMSFIHPIAERNRKRRLSGSHGVSRDVLTRAMTVTPRPAGSPRGSVVRAAVMYKGFAWSMPAPARHSDIFNEMFDMLGGMIDAPQTEGFLVASGHFVDRVDGLAAARAAGQPFIEQPTSGELFSENLW